jgi:cardiolipin synthase C
MNGSLSNLGSWRLAPMLALTLALVLSACATAPGAPSVRNVRPVPVSALPPASEGEFERIESRLRAAHGAEASGFELLDRNEDGLRWRLALIDSAVRSIDVQYYLWYGDAAGLLLIERLLAAADRGVRVRVLVDDLNTLLSDAGTVTLRDRPFALVDAHPNLELRVFNPWTDRSLFGRAGEMAGDMERLNQRMHNKALIIDNRATILGGRNIGDDYMGLHEAFNFHDLDVLGIGPVARQASAVFDAYWNSEWVLPIAALGLATPGADRRAGRVQLQATLPTLRQLERFPLAPRSWSDELQALATRLHIGTSRVHSDVPADGHIEHRMMEVMYALTATARRELLIVNAYIIPDERAIVNLRTLKAQGVDIRILTNSLASHDVPAVNSHYKSWRRPLREASAALHEIRHDAAIQPLVADTPPTRAGFMGLHSKGMVVDRARVYIGSMNFDPRSAAINSEMGVIIESHGLAEALAQIVERGLDPTNSWRVEVGADGNLSWTNDRETVMRQPARSFWQRVEDVIFMAFPRNLY